VPISDLDNDLCLLAAFLARQDLKALDVANLGQPADLLVLIGSSLLMTAQIAADAVKSGAVRRILVSGGVGHSTEDLRLAVRRCPDLRGIAVDGRSEAEILTDVLVGRHQLVREAILVESVSTNCGANAWESKRVLTEVGLQPASVVIVQDPTMQLRTHASFERSWRGEPAPTFISFAPFVPVVESGVISPSGQWTFDRFVSLLMGEIPRLTDGPGGYGPKGRDFIQHVDIPESVLLAHARIASAVGIHSRG